MSIPLFIEFELEGDGHIFVRADQIEQIVQEEEKILLEVRLVDGIKVSHALKGPWEEIADRIEDIGD